MHVFDAAFVYFQRSSEEAYLEKSRELKVLNERIKEEQKYGTLYQFLQHDFVNCVWIFVLYQR